MTMGATSVELGAYDTLREVIDPELGISIIDMGLVYIIEHKPEAGLEVKMTLTSKGCPMGETITSNALAALQEKFPQMPVKVELVWEPPWTPESISPEGRKKINMV